MPVFLKNGIDRILGVAPLYLGAIIGNMISTTNVSTVVLGSYSSGIPFTNGIVFRSFAFILGMIMTIIYMFFYYKKIMTDETKSIVYDIRKEILDFCLEDEKKEKEKENKKEENEKTTEIKDENILLKEGKGNNQEIANEKENINDNDENENDTFSCKQK